MIEQWRSTDNDGVGHNTAAESDSAAGPDPRGRLSQLATTTTIRRQRRVWSKRVSNWDHHTPAGLEQVTAAVIAAAAVRPGDQVVDLGCGTGQLSIPLAERGARVLAIDVSAQMISRLEQKARAIELARLECLALPIENLSLPGESVDLIVTSYALHHLRDADKARLLRSAYQWLRPGGRLLVADMMFGRGATSDDRAIIKSKIKVLASRGIGGWWRIAKNSYRYLIRVQERPVSASAWTSMFLAAGFTSVSTESIVSEAALVSGRRPLR